MGKTLYKTGSGRLVIGDSVVEVKGRLGRQLKGKVDLILTSPPFPLNKKKRYGNRQGAEYKQWFTDLAEPLSDLLAPTGSIVMELGNAWMPGRPVQSLLHLES